VRQLTGWANAAMLAVAVAALGVLTAAFLPLVEVWAVHRVARTGGGQPHLVVVLAQVAMAGGVALAHLVAGVCVLVWTGRACRNLGLPRGVAVALWPVAAPFVLGRLGAGRWLAAAWWVAWLAGAAAGAAGLLLGPASRDVDAALADGRAVDGAGGVLAAQVAARLPGAALYLGAAVLFLVLVHRITVAQPPSPPRSATIGA